MSALHIFTKKITEAGAWSDDERVAVEMMIKTAMAIERRTVAPLKALIWVNEPAARCAARIAGRGQPADTVIKPSELYKIEKLHSEMFTTLVPVGTEVATFMDMTQHRAPGIIKELCRWIECLMLEGSTSELQRMRFNYISILVKTQRTALFLITDFFRTGRQFKTPASTRSRRLQNRS